MAELLETDGDIADMFHPSLVWVEVPNDQSAVDVGWSYSGDEFISPPSEPLADVVANRLALINVACEQAIALISAGYPPSEVLSWPKQEREARAYAADPAAATPLIDALATARGIAKPELASRIIDKADLFAQVSGQLIGKRQALEDQLVAMQVAFDDPAQSDPTPEQIEAVVW